MSTDDEGFFKPFTKEDFIEGVADIKKALDKPLRPTVPFKGEPLSEEAWLELCGSHAENRVIHLGKAKHILSIPLVPRKTPSDT